MREINPFWKINIYRACVCGGHEIQQWAFTFRNSPHHFTNIYDLVSSLFIRYKVNLSYARKLAFENSWESPFGRSLGYCYVIDSDFIIRHTIQVNAVVPLMKIASNNNNVLNDSMVFRFQHWDFVSNEINWSEVNWMYVLMILRNATITKSIKIEWKCKPCWCYSISSSILFYSIQFQFVSCDSLPIQLIYKLQQYKFDHLQY